MNIKTIDSIHPAAEALQLPAVFAGWADKLRQPAPPAGL